MKNILLLTDFSKDAKNAVNYGLNLFGEDANYTLLNVNHEPRVDSDVLFSVRDILREKSENKLKNEIRIIQDQSHFQNLKIKSQSEFGEIESILEDIDAVEDFDYVIMGTKGKSGESLMFGSLAKKVVRDSLIPIIIIPEKVTYKKIDTIVYATNLIEDESFLIESIKNFALLFNSKLTILHVAKSPISDVEITNEFNKIKQRTPYSKMDFIELINDDVKDAINSYIEKNKPDLLALTTYTTTLINRIFHRSITKDLILNIQIPILVFNRKKFSYIFLG